MKLMAKTDACTAQFYCGMKKYSSVLIMYTKHAIYFFYFFSLLERGGIFIHTWGRSWYGDCVTRSNLKTTLGVIGVLVFDDIV